MKRLLRHLGGGIAVIEIEGKQFMAVRISSGRRTFSLTRFMEVKNDAGFVVENGGIREWNVEGTCEIDGSIYFYGPYHPGMPLVSYFASPPEDPLPLIEALTRGIIELPRQAYPVYANSICIDYQSESFLCFPPRIIDCLADDMDMRERERIGYSGYARNREREENLVFFLSAAVFRLTTGISIEEHSGEDDPRGAVKEGKLTLPHIVNPRLKEEFSLFLHECLLHPDSISVASFHRRISAFDTLKDTGLTREQLESRVKEHEYIVKAQQNRTERQYFIRKHGWKLLIFICAGIAAGIVGLRFIRGTMEPPFTAGMNQKEVIERFYTAYSELDHETMEHCVAGDAGEELIKKALNLFVISRIRHAYEGSGSFVAAEEWLEEGAPALDNDPFIFGITDLQIKEESSTVYMVRYREFLPGRMDSERVNETEQDWIPPAMSEVSRRVRLEMIKNAWHIAAIEEIPGTAY